MALLFPSNPIENQIYTAPNGTSYYWNGFAWMAGFYDPNITGDLTLSDNIVDEGTAAYHNVPLTGNAAADEVVMGNDTRLTNDRTPLAHNHDSRYYTESEVDTLLTGKSDTGHLHTGVYAPIVHDHDLTYAPIIHDHDLTYSAIGHIHDDRYMTDAEIAAAYIPKEKPAITLTYGATTAIAAYDEVYKVTVSGVATTWQFNSVPAAPTVAFFMLHITNGGSQTQNWPASVIWPAGTAPDFAVTGSDLLAFYTSDGGVTWYAIVMGLGYSA